MILEFLFVLNIFFSDGTHMLKVYPVANMDECIVLSEAVYKRITTAKLDGVTAIDSKCIKREDI